MKKTLLILLLVLVVALSLGISACDMFQHKHTFSAEWSYDKTEHWLKATCEHTEETSSKGEHNFNSLNMCTTCGYVKDLPPTDYTVTFDANGGEMDYKMDTYEVFSTPVAVGEAISVNVYKKLTPVLDGYEFTGWFVGSDEGKLWNFEEDVVNDDVKLVAGWKALFVDVDVNFYMNDGTDSDPVVKSTVMGKIDYVPEREGYVFKGWWIGTGNKDTNGYYVVTEKFDTNKVVSQYGSPKNLYATWAEEATNVIVLSAPSLEENAPRIEWKQVEGATRYIVKISDGASGESSTQSVSRGDGEKEQFVLQGAGTYTVSVCSVGDGKTSVTSGYSSITVKRSVLPSTTISFDAATNMLTWTSVDNSWQNECVYNVSIDGKEVAKSLRVTYFDMTDFQAGQHTVTVVAERYSCVSSVTTKTVTKYKLSTPQPVMHFNSTSDDCIITWDDIFGADEYHIQVGGNTYTRKENTFTVKADNEARRNGYTFTVYASNSEARYLDSDKSQGLGLGRSVEVTMNFGNNYVDVSYSKIAYTTYTVTFDDNYEDAPVTSVTVDEDKPLQYRVHSRPGYMLTGWYVDRACTTPYDFSKTLTGDVTVYAGWKQIATSSGSTVNFVTRYNTSSNYYSANVDHATKTYVYFTAYADGEYTFYYKNRWSSVYYRVNFNVYKMGNSSSPLVSVSTSQTSFSSQTFEVVAGNVYCVEMSMYNTSYDSTAEFYITGARYPAQGGIPQYTFTTQKTELERRNETTQYIFKGSEVKLVARESNVKFAGWYNGEELVSTDRTLVITVSSDSPYLTYDSDAGTYSLNLTPKY